MKTISFEEAKPGDWLVSDGGSVRLEITCPGDMVSVAGACRPVTEWSFLGFHVEREDPPKVVRVECEWRMKGGIFAKRGGGISGPIDFKLRDQGLADRTPLTALIFPADLLEELDEAAREFDVQENDENSMRLHDALAACGIGSARAEGDER